MNYKHLIKPVAVLALICGAPASAGTDARRRTRVADSAGRSAARSVAAWVRSAAWARAAPRERSAAASTTPTRCVVTPRAPSSARVTPRAMCATSASNDRRATRSAGAANGAASGNQRHRGQRMSTAGNAAGAANGSLSGVNGAANGNAAGDLTGSLDSAQDAAPSAPETAPAAPVSRAEAQARTRRPTAAASGSLPASSMRRSRDRRVEPAQPRSFTSPVNASAQRGRERRRVGDCVSSRSNARGKRKAAGPFGPAAFHFRRWMRRSGLRFRGFGRGADHRCASSSLLSKPFLSVSSALKRSARRGIFACTSSSDSWPSLLTSASLKRSFHLFLHVTAHLVARLARLLRSRPA